MPKYNSFGMSPISRRSPIGMNIGAFADVVKTLDTKYQETAKQQSAIDMAIGQLPVNAAEDAWRMGVADEIRNQINSVDNPNDRYLTAIRAAGNLMSRPDVIGRIRAEAEYQNFVTQTQKRTDLTEDDKAWALANNPYSYQDTRDSNGRIIGGTMWKAGKTPVGMIDYNKILAEAKQLVFQEAGGATNIVFTDAEGNETTDPSKGINGVRYYQNGEWKGISGEKLNNLLESAIDNTPGARARLDQDWEVANWKYNQMTPEEQETNKPRELFADNGKKYSKQEWYNNKFSRAVTAMSGMQRSSTIKYADDYSKYMELKRANSLNNDSYNNNGTYKYSDLITTPTTPYLQEADDTVSLASGKVNDAISSIEGLMPLLKTNTWTIAKGENDFTKLSNLIKNQNIRINGRLVNYYSTLSPQLKAKVDRVLTTIDDNGSIISSVLRDQSKPSRDAIMFKSAFTSGSELPLNNNFSNSYFNLYNRLGNDTSLYDGKVKKEAQSFQYQFRDSESMKDWATKSGIDLTDINSISVGTNDGMPTVTISKSNPMNYKALDVFQSGDYADTNGMSDAISRAINGGGFKELIRYRSGNVYGVDENGERLSKVMPTDMIRLSSIANDAIRQSATSINPLAADGVRMTAKHGQLPGIQYADRQLAAGIIDEKTYNASVNREINGIVNSLFGANGSQIRIAAIGEDGFMRDLDAKGRAEAMRNIRTYIDNNRSNIVDKLGTYVAGDNIGLDVRIPGAFNNSKNTYVEGDIPEQQYVIFGQDIPVIQNMQDDTSFRAAVKLDKMSRFIGSTSTLYDGNVVKSIGNNRFTVNGTEQQREVVERLIDNDMVYKRLMLAKVDVTNEKGYDRLLDAFTIQVGIDPNTPEGIQFKQAIDAKVIQDLNSL